MVSLMLKPIVQNLDLIMGLIAVSTFPRNVTLIGQSGIFWSSTKMDMWTRATPLPPQPVEDEVISMINPCLIPSQFPKSWCPGFKITLYFLYLISSCPTHLLPVKLSILYNPLEHLSSCSKFISRDSEKIRQSCLTLCDPMNYSLLGSSVHGILHTRILEWVAIPFQGSSWPRDESQVSCVAGGLFTIWATMEALSIHELLNGTN